MPLGRLSIRHAPGNRLHHLWCNNGSWWCHYTLHFDGRKRRIRRSLLTRSLPEAILRRDELFARIDQEGEIVPERRRPERSLPEDPVEPFIDPVHLGQRQPEIVSQADLFLCVGTSLQVYPANSLIFATPHRARRIIVNPEVPDLAPADVCECIPKTACDGVPDLVASLLLE